VLLECVLVSYLSCMFTRSRYVCRFIMHILHHIDCIEKVKLT